MKKIKFQVGISVLLLFILWACDRNTVFEKYNHIPKNEWYKDSLMVFNFPISDTLENHNLYINIRNDVKYNYSNLWLFIEIHQPGNIAVADTFELSLAEPSGRWLGDGFGGIKTRQVVFKRDVYFPVSGEYKINIQHGMREDVLMGISDVGFRVEQIN